MLVQSTPRSQLPGVFITDELGLSGVFMIRESFRVPGGVIFTDFKKHKQSLKGLSFLTLTVGYFNYL
jgi:hypothetical protein